MITTAIPMGHALLLSPMALTLWPQGRRRDRKSTAPLWAAGIVTVGGAGWLPVAPGSFGALAALPIGWLLRDASLPVWAAAIAALTWAGGAATTVYLRTSDGKDPQEIVVDELVGCLTALAFVPFEWPWVTAAYLLFRVFDAWKPGIIRLCERRLPGAYGVLGDDLAAGLLAGFALLLARRIAGL